MSIGEQPISKYMSASPVVVGSEQTLTFAQDLMREKGFRHLPVLHGGSLYGVLSDRDIGLVAGLNDVNPDTTTIEEAASQEIYTVGPDTALSEVVSTMAGRKIGSAVITKGKEVVGIFTNHDAMKLLARLLSES